jgi:DNA-binding transcriptional ArsR family regulator
MSARSQNGQPASSYIITPTTLPKLSLQTDLCIGTLGNVTDRVLEVDAAALKAMAHPLRVQIMRILQLRKRASVTSLADELGETTGATSYHLRQLARFGFVEEFERGDEDVEQAHTAGRKQRWWRMSVDQIHMTGFEFMTNEDTREAAGFLLREFQADRSRRLANWFATVTQWPAEWQRASSDMDGTLELSPRQTRALADEMAALLRKYRELKPGKAARTVDVQYAIFPADTGTRP